MWSMNLHSLLGHRCLCPAAAPTVVASRCSRRGSCQHARGCRRDIHYPSHGRECLWPGRRQKQSTRSRAASVSAPSASPELSVPRGETAGAAFLLEGVTVQVWFQCVFSSKFCCAAGNSCGYTSYNRLVKDTAWSYGYRQVTGTSSWTWIGFQCLGTALDLLAPMVRFTGAVNGLSSSEQVHVRCNAGLLPQVAANLPS